MADFLLSLITPGSSVKSLSQLETNLRSIVPHVDFDRLTVSRLQALLPPGVDIPQNVVEYIKQKSNKMPPGTGLIPGIPGGGAKLQDCTVKELKAVAKKRNIKLTGLTRKADIIAKIRKS
jgi:hypothetical protein